MKRKLDELKKIIRECESALVAFSGGVDSTFLLSITFQVLGERSAAFTGVSETYTGEELELARKFCKSRNIRHFLVNTCELEMREFASNPPDRCFYCKSELFTHARDIAESHGYKWIFDGTNADDVSDYRPGREAARRLGVRSPLLEAGLTKAEIRMLSRELAIDGWDRPANACLASRFAYGVEITRERLAMIAQAESFLRSLGFRTVRVRYHHGGLARIEIGREEIDGFMSKEMRGRIANFFRELGFKYIALDLEGYMSGSMNRMIE